VPLAAFVFYIADEKAAFCMPSMRSFFFVKLVTHMLNCLPWFTDRRLFWFALSGAVDVERHARDFMEAAKKLQSYFISLQREEQPTTEDMLRKVWSTSSL
jgi:hypothetical protein